MVIEQWREVPGYEGVYDVSDRGCLRSRTRVVKEKSGRPHTIHGRELSLKRSTVKSGAVYLRIQLWHAGKYIYPGVHQVVAWAFLGPAPRGCEVNHKDGDTTRNCLANLEYVTRSYNLCHARDVLNKARGEVSHRSVLTEVEVRDIRRLASQGETHRALALRFGVVSGTIGFIVKGKTWRHTLPGYVGRSQGGA